MTDKQSQAVAILAELCNRDPASIRPEHDLVVDLGVNSPLALELLVRLEEGLEIQITDEEAARIESVDDVLRCVHEKTGAPG